MPRKAKKRNLETGSQAAEVTPVLAETDPTLSSEASSDKLTTRRKRSRTASRPATNSDLFPGESVHRLASSRLIWEGANILTQREDLRWEKSEDGLCYESLISKGKGFLSFWLTQD